MALTKPTLNQVPAWDATKGYTFTFNVVGGTQVAGSVLTIRDNFDNEVVYQHTESSYNFVNTIPANILTNGGNYNATLYTLDLDLNQSPESNTIQFYCYSTPQIDFTNLPSGDIVPSSEFPFEAMYSQSQGEMLNSYKFTLYNSARIQIATSGTMYATNITPSYQGDTVLIPLEYTFSGLSDNTTYYVKIDGLTANGTQITTDFQQFFVRYSAPSAFAQLTATNICDGGYILVDSNVVLIEGTAYPEAIYIDDEKIDVTGDGHYVLFDKGYTIPEDFTAKAWFESANIGNLIEFNGNGNIKIEYLQDQEDNNKYYCKLTADDLYMIYSDSIEVSPLDELCVQIRKSGNLYDLILSKVSEFDDMYFITSDNRYFATVNGDFLIARE